MKMEPVNDLERTVDNLEKMLTSHQQETEKRDKIKTEETMEKDIMVEAYVETIKDLSEEITGLKLQSWMDKETIKEIMLKNAKTVEELSRKLSACEDAKRMSDWIQEDMKRRELDNRRCVEDLRLKNLEASRNVEELRSRMLAYEEEKKTASRVHEQMILRELEYNKCVEDLRRQNSEANRKNSEADRKVEELRSRMLAYEEEKKTASRVHEQMILRELEYNKCVEDLRRQNSEANRKNSEADRKVEELRDRVSALEEENRMAVRVREEMEDRSLEACKAAEVNIEKFRNVLSIAEDLWELLKMNVEDLESVKEKFGFVTDEEGLISSAVVSGDSRAGATTANGVAGPHARNKAVEELTVSATEQPTKKRKTNESLIKRKWIFGADMVRAFEEDDELCLHAVCALFRQHVSTSQSTESSNKRFYHFEALGGVELVGCLTGGDPEHNSLTMRPVDEVKQENPDIVNQCRRLAICYSSYFTAMPRTNEPLSRSLSLVCCDRYACGTCGRVMLSLSGLVEI